jgi:hypothetical protein
VKGPHTKPQNASWIPPVPLPAAKAPAGIDPQRKANFRVG